MVSSMSLLQVHGKYIHHLQTSSVTGEEGAESQTDYYGRYHERSCAMADCGRRSEMYLHAARRRTAPTSRTDHGATQLIAEGRLRKCSTNAERGDAKRVARQTQAGTPAATRRGASARGAHMHR